MTTMPLLIFVAVMSSAVLAATTYLVAQGMLDNSAFTFVAGGIIGGIFGSYNPRRSSEGDAADKRSETKE